MIKGLLELFGIMPHRRSPLDVSIDKAVDDFRRKHAESVECLVCQMIASGADPRRLEVISTVRHGDLVIWVRERGKDEK